MLDKLYEVLDKLYEDIGGKIKNWAKWIFIVEAIGAVITGIVFLFGNGIEDSWWALFIIIFGPIVAWVSSWILYAFGQIVEDVHAMRDNEGTSAEAKAKREEHKASEKAKRDSKENARSEEEENKRQIWEKEKQNQGTTIGNCEMCGSRKKELVSTEFEDFFGKATKNLCYNCFCKYHKDLK